MLVPKPNHKRRKPPMKKRGEFNAQTKLNINERDQCLCQRCGASGREIHHVKFKSQGGRGVYTNGITLCQTCHTKCHREIDEARYWQNEFISRYGADYYKDEHDV